MVASDRRRPLIKVLCTCLPGHGHFLPMVPLARALARAGHEVAFATAEDLCPSVRRAGFTAYPAGMSLARQLDEAGRRYPESRLAPSKARFESFVPRMLGGVAAPAKVADLVPLVDEWRPDVIVHEETDFAGPVAADVAGLPYADQSVGILRPLGMARLAGESLAPERARRGLEPAAHGGLFRYLYLDVCPPSLQRPAISQVSMAHPVHNLSAGDASGDLPGWVAGLPDRPTAYVSLGTIFNQDLTVFTSVLEGLGSLPFNVVVTVGHDGDPAALGLQPSNVHVERFIPQSLLLPRCDVVVNQGGTALLDIVGHGLPVLVLPQGANQFHNAESFTAASVARTLLPDQVVPEAVAGAVTALLEDPSYRSRAQAVAEELAAMPGPAEGVRLVERLAAERAPLVATAAPRS